MMDWLAPRRGQCLLDVAGGTEIFHFALKRAVMAATVLDLTSEMLEEGKLRAEARNLGLLDWVVGDAMALPFSDISLRLHHQLWYRNVTRPEDAK